MVGDSCACPVCAFVRRLREIDGAPSVEGYAALLRDVMDHWLIESEDDCLKIYLLENRVKELEAEVAMLRAGAEPQGGER